ncbi:MAG TPA: nuclear transport factor 2 family protein [Acidimicrobiales bacterium]|nr:nuclear transport factor 2 family protein [Acidimicrobiales bacterium]
MTPIGTKLHQRRQQLIERLLTAQNRGDLGAALACFTHPRYELIGNNRVYDGADEVRHYYAVTRGYFPDLRFDVIAVHHGDHALVCELWMTGTHLGSGRDFEATGRSFRCRTAIIFSFTGEQLIGARVYYDTGTIARQLA